MRSSDASAAEGAGSFDAIAHELQSLREEAGPVSYAELTRRVAALRLARGMNPIAATPPRSTVYNVFRTGRARVDVELVRDIVTALGASPEEADEWARRCVDARRAAEARIAQRKKAADGLASRDLLPTSVPPSRGFLVFCLLACVVLNHSVHWLLAAPLDLPLYLDMIGTGVAALAFGPWPGVAVAIATGITGAMLEDGILLFTLVNVAGALVWGYGVRRFHMGAELPRFFLLNLAVATSCTLVATPILVLARGGAYGSVGEIAAAMQNAGLPFLAATFTSNITTSIIDKMLTGFVALTIFAALHYSRRIPAEHMPLIRTLARENRSSPGNPGFGLLPVPIR